MITPTEVIDAQNSSGIAARKAYNNAHRLILDDGAAVTYWNTSNTGEMDQPFPWMTAGNQVRVGAGVTSRSRWSWSSATAPGSCSRRPR